MHVTSCERTCTCHVCAIHASHLLHAVHFQYHAYPITENISTCYLHVCTHTNILYYKLAAELATFMHIGLSWLEHMATFQGRWNFWGVTRFQGNTVISISWSVRHILQNAFPACNVKNLEGKRAGFEVSFDSQPATASIIILLCGWLFLNTLYGHLKPLLSQVSTSLCLSTNSWAFVCR